jgi:PadR family transcriptional regulator AphA
VLKVFFAEHGTIDDMLASIRAIHAEATAAIEHFHGIADLYANGQGQYPERFALSALVARLLGEQHAATVRWAECAEKVVSGWDTPSGGRRGLGSRDDPRDRRSLQSLETAVGLRSHFRLSS